ncbi:hypothetical protein F0562_002148 [Nyssa sinensis]|uniref:Retrovirus-related Pol polyprotein from transposon TNT 1-94-like beta-barrel domain-containing protein n=1 Tax=Nyssa sinensis TaxID=561372 RepID=A0A5J5C6K6_9ASTE|nr:hypothetical protein F0562_002148 [Nyssa sinensis]
MDADASFSSIAPPVFDGENYQIWAVRMETYLDAMDLWEAVEEDYEVLSLPDNPTMAQIKNHKDRKTRKSKAKACLFAAVSSTIFTRVMALKSAKAIWDYLKIEYEGNERIKGMQVLNLIRDFELQKMNESETIKEYSDKLLSIANKVRLLGSDLHDSRIVEKILVMVPEKFEATIRTLENTKDLSKITLAELLNALQAQEQRRVMRQGGVVEGALPVKHQEEGKMRKKKNKKNFAASGDATANSNKNKIEGTKGNHPPCQHCGRKGHPPFKCWRRSDAKCSKCNQLGHEAVICKGKAQQQEVEAQVADQEVEDQLFVATCFASSRSSESWLIDSGCTNHMTYDKELFKELESTTITKVRIGNGDHIAVKGKGTMAIESCLDAAGQEMFKVRMRGKGFSLDPIEEKQAAFPISESTTQWNWENSKRNQNENSNDLVDDSPVRGTRLLSDIYQRCNIAVCEPARYEDAKKDQSMSSQVANPPLEYIAEGPPRIDIFLCW